MATLDLVSAGETNWATQQNANLTALNTELIATTAKANAAQVAADLDDDTAALAADSESALRTELNAAYARPIGCSVVLIGDSVVAQSSANAGSEETHSGTDYVYRATGFFGWAQTLMGHRFEMLRNAGVSGERTDQVAARIASDVVALSPEWCVVLAGINDVLQNVATATVIDNLYGIYDELLAAGIRVVAAELLPLDSASSGQKATIHAVNAAIRDYARAHRNVFVVAWHSAVANPSTGSWLSGASSDGTHPNGYGAFLIASVMSEALSSFVPPTLTLLGSNADPVTKLTNGRFTGAVTTGHPSGVSGSLATGWSVGWESTAGSAVLSKVARTDGINGEWQEIELTGAGTFRMFQQANPLSAWGLSVGDSIQAELEFEADGDWSGITRFEMNVEFFNGGVGNVSALANSGTTLAGIQPRKGVLRTPVGVIPGTAARAQIFFRFFGTAGTIRLDRARLVKV